MEVDSEEFQNDNINKKESNLFGNEKKSFGKKKEFFFFFFLIHLNVFLDAAILLHFCLLSKFILKKAYLFVNTTTFSLKDLFVSEFI